MNLVRSRKERRGASPIDARWLGYVIEGRELPPPDFWYIRWWRQVMDYDPLETLSRVTVPVLNRG